MLLCFWYFCFEVLCRRAAAFSLSYDGTIARTRRVKKYSSVIWKQCGNYFLPYADRIANDWIFVRQRTRCSQNQIEWPKIKVGPFQITRTRYTNSKWWIKQIDRKGPHNIIEFVEELSKSSWMLTISTWSVNLLKLMVFILYELIIILNKNYVSFSLTPLRADFRDNSSS